MTSVMPASPSVLGKSVMRDRHAASGQPASGSILLVEDDPNIQRSISYQLGRQGYRVTCCADGERGLEEALTRRYAVLVLDVMLPKLDGFRVCQQVREASPRQLIIMISARDSDLDKITGLEYGADDYVAKPFSPAELEARIRALRRRAGGPLGANGVDAAALIACAGVELDCSRHELRANGEAIRLTPKEMALLRLLISSPGRVFTRENLLAQVWGYTHPGYHRAVDAHINRLKTKLHARLGATPAWLEGVYGVGYRFRELDEP